MKATEYRLFLGVSFTPVVTSTASALTRFQAMLLAIIKSIDSSTRVNTVLQS